MAYRNIKKIALFLPSLNSGGAQRVMVNLAKGFTERGIDVDLVLAKAEGPYLNQIPTDIRIVDLQARRTLTSIPSLMRYLRHEEPSVMLSAIEHANIVAIWAALLARVRTRVVVSVHTSYHLFNFSTIRGRLWHILIRKFYPMANTIVVVSEAAKQDFLSTTRLKLEHVKVIYNPVVTPDLFKMAKMQLHHPWFAVNEPPVILGAGRLSKEKDFPNLIRAFALVHQMCPVRLLIIGEGEERDELENLVMELGINKDVDLPGFVENPYAYMANATVFVLSSLYEGLPTVLIEAMATGTPVVSTDCPSGPREILGGGKYGKLVPIGEPQALAKSILDVIQSRSVPDINTAAIAPYTLEKSVNQYIQVLHCGSDN